MTKYYALFRLSSSLRHVICISLVLFLSACGGGLGGSGDGGKNTSLIIIPLPDSFDSPYQFRSIPDRFMARFPSSLTAGSSTETEEPSAYGMLTATVSDLIDRKLEIGLLQLVLEANWAAMTEQCSTTPEDSECNLDTSRFVTTYTSAMASWEYLLRANLELENSGLKEVPPEASKAIEELVKAKIGTELVVDNGVLTRITSGSYRFEITTTSNLGFGDTIYTARWSEDRVITFVSLAELDSDSVDSLQSSINFKKGSSSLNNSILATTYEGEADRRRERQLNLNQPINSYELQIETQETEISGSTRNDYYSIGNADDLGGYLRSEHVSEDATDSVTSDFFRESFTGDATIESQSVCRMSKSEAQCDLENKWEVLTPRDPIFSRFFLTQAELTELESRLKPFNLKFEGVSDTMDVLVLIRRENLSISVSSEGVVIKLPGLGTFDFTTNSVTPDIPTSSINSSNGLFAQYADSVLCRANRTVIDYRVTYRSFCAGSTEEIEDALVVGESFVGGELLIEWQANASIKVIED